MKIRKAVRWVFLCTVCNLSAQNNYSFDFAIKTQPTENIKINETRFGVDYSKTFNSKYSIENELKFNSKNIDYYNNVFSIYLTNYTEVSNKFVFSYFKSDKMHINFEIEPYIASENNLKLSDFDLLGELYVDFILSSNKKLTVGASRNNFLGKTMVLPVFSYYYEYDKKLNIAIGFPETKLSYSNTIRNVFSLKNAFNGIVYNLESTSKTLALNSTKSSFSQLTTSLEYERNMDRNWYVNFKVGYDFNREYLLLDNNYNTTFDFKIKDGYNFGLTIKYKH
jgi:hypothetical protein